MDDSTRLKWIALKIERENIAGPIRNAELLSRDQRGDPVQQRLALPAESHFDFVAPNCAIQYARIIVTPGILLSHDCLTWAVREANSDPCAGRQIDYRPKRSPLTTHREREFAH